MEHTKPADVKQEARQHISGLLVWKGRDVRLSSNIITLQPREVAEVERGLKAFKG